PRRSRARACGAPSRGGRRSRGRACRRRRRRSGSGREASCVLPPGQQRVSMGSDRTMPGSLTPTSRRVAAVERAAAALFALAEAGELGTNELARRLGTNASTASRLLATLAASDLVETTPGGRYRLGLGALRLGLAVRLDLRGAAQRDLLLLGQATGETVTLSAPGHPDAFTVSFLQ